MKPFLDSKGNVPKNLLQNAVFEADIYGKVNSRNGDDNRCQVQLGYRLAGQD